METLEYYKVKTRYKLTSECVSITLYLKLKFEVFNLSVYNRKTHSQIMIHKIETEGIVRNKHKKAKE